jgi:hypothetical protein
VSAQVNGRHVALHVDIGEVYNQNLEITHAPTLSRLTTNGAKDIQLAVTLYQGDTVGKAHNENYAISLSDPLKPGNYKVEVKVRSWSQLKNETFPTQTLTTSFQVK